MADFHIEGDLTVTRVDEPPPEPPPGEEVVYEASFAGLPVGPFTMAHAQASLGKMAGPGMDWPGDSWYAEHGMTLVADDEGGTVLQVKLKANTLEDGPVLVIPLARGLAECRYRMRLRFVDGFDFSEGGKLPGIGATNNDSYPPAGGGAPTNGYSSRHMWLDYSGVPGTCVAYTYHPSQSGTYGDNETFGQPFTVGQWHVVTQRLAVNQVGQSDGILQGALDDGDAGQPTLDEQSYVWRNAADWLTNRFMLSVFRGGSGTDWESTRDGFIQFSGFRITAPI
jgi:Polysaccharide lyase 14